MPANFSKIKTVVTGETITAADRNAEFDNVLNNFTPSGMDDYSLNTAQMQATADPYPGATESLATSTQGELERLRYVIKQITGESQWYIDPDTTIAALAAIPPYSDGWYTAGETWIYASATTFTISGDKTSKYRLGDRIKFDNSTTKYFYVVSVSYSAPNTTVTVTGGSDYSIANSAISNNYFSREAAPINFPFVFNYSPTLTGWASVGSAKFSLIGNQCTVYALGLLKSTGGSSARAITAPISTGANGGGVARCSGTVESATTIVRADAYIGTSTNSITQEKENIGTPADWAGGGDTCDFVLTYFI